MAHPPRALLVGTIAACAVTLVFAQSTPSPKASANSRITTKRGAAANTAKAVKPDPDLLDGSLYDPEKKPLFGMISEIELAGSEQKSERVGGAEQPPPDGQTAQQPGGGGPPAGPKPPEPPAGGAPGSEIAEKQDDRDSGPQAKPEGIAVKNLETPEGAAGQQGAPATPPREMQIGDATLQIQTIEQKAEIVGAQSTSTQQYEKKMPQGRQTDNRNRGAEKGRVMPKGL